MSQPKIPSIKMPGMSRLQMPQPLVNVTLNPGIFEDLIKSQGVRMLHSRPVPCPNIQDIHAPQHSPACNLCYNGFVYYNEKEFTGAFSNNVNSRQFNQNGTWDQDQADIIVPVFDSSNTLLDVQFFDQILLPDAPLVRYYQHVEHGQSGLDRCQFEVVRVDFMIDSSGKMYRPDIDFVVENGKIRWVTNNRPGWDPVLKRGIVYSVNYYTRPRFTIVGLPHQMRLAQTQGPGGVGTPNVQARFPMLCIVRKDFIPFDQFDRVGSPDRPEPKSGSFGTV